MSATADGAFATAARKSADFVCTRGTQKYANHFKIKAVPAVLFTDADGDEIYRSTFGNAASLENAMNAALAKYQNRPVSWKSEVGASTKKLLVIGFDDEPGEALKALEDRSIVKFHEKCEFVKLPAQKDGEAAKKYGVTSFPAIVLCDASAEAPEKSPLEKLQGKKSTAAVKLAIHKALARLEAKK